MVVYGEMSLFVQRAIKETHKHAKYAERRKCEYYTALVHKVTTGI